MQGPSSPARFLVPKQVMSMRILGVSIFFMSGQYKLDNMRLLA